MTPIAHTEITPKLVDSLYAEAMTLADRARRYFDKDGADDRASLDPVARVAFSCESLKVTTRLMHVVAWLMVRKAVEAGEIGEAEASASDRRLGRAPDAADEREPELPPRARDIIAASRDLYGRVKRLDAQLVAPSPADDGQEQGARALLDRLRASI